ncbi:MAG: hypothetical protein D6815_02490 [Candidatus Dadabacteria bacterium]|nr:MAG: hypothetical protein D6815_02490 [Candidatus Dadabacteria bacterium]
MRRRQATRKTSQRGRREKDMARGDHIRVWRGAYYHHGIELADGTVVHYTGEPGNKANARVRRTSMAAFLKGGKKEVVHYGRALPPAEVEKRALSQLGRRRYSLFWENCEHFATWCKTGKWRSEQVGRAKGVAITATAKIAARLAVPTAVAEAGAVAGASGAGILSGLAAIGPGGAVGGVLTLAAGPAVAANVGVSKMLADDEHLPEEERKARRNGRAAAKAGTAAGAMGSIAAISASGSVAGLSGAGIASGLASIGSAVGGGMLAGVLVTALAPAACAVGAAWLGYKLSSRSGKESAAS